MDMSKIREILGAHNVELTEDMDEEVLLAKLTELLAGKDAQILELAEKAKPKANEPDLEKEQLSEEKTQLEEQNMQLAEDKVQLIERVEALEERNRLTEKTAFFDKITLEGKIAPADREDFEELYDAKPEKVVAMLKDREPVASFAEHGSSSEKKEEGDDEDKVVKLAEQMVKDEQITFAEATLRVRREHPELAGDE